MDTKGRFVGLIKDPAAWSRLGRALRETRERVGLSQKELAAAARVSAGAVQAAEAGTVPRSRMPQTLAPIAKALGWPAGAVDSVLAGSEPPGGWQSIRVELEEGQVEAIIVNAMVRATDNATGAEIRNAARIAMDELRRYGFLSKTDGTQPNGLSGNA